jgi:hypothetical protein
MCFWDPDPDASQLLEWWLPLVRAGRRALDAEVPWLIIVDEWDLHGRFVRRDRPDVWMYRHYLSRRDLYVDESGQPYRFIPNTSGPSRGRFKEISIRRAVWAADLPGVSEGVWFQPPGGRRALELVSES